LRQPIWPLSLPCHDNEQRLPPADQIEQARQRIADGVPKTKIARDLHVSRQTLYTALVGQGRYHQ